jgi:xanthine dehydrogenase accessory factor
MIKFIDAICRLLEKGEGFVLATILGQAGSTPRTAGTKMIVRSDGAIIGTIGGGKVEAEVIRGAPEIFRTTAPRIETFDLTGKEAVGSMDMICGGRLEVLMELVEADDLQWEIFQTLREALRNRRECFSIATLGEIDAPLTHVRRCLVLGDGSTVGACSWEPSGWTSLLKEASRSRYPVLIVSDRQRLLIEPPFIPGEILLFGAGHVSRQVADLAELVDFRTVVLDDREEFANRGRFPRADEVLVLSSFDRALEGREIDDDHYVVIVTRGHSHDKTVLAQVLTTNAGYIGMIGSKRKRDAIYNALLGEGFTRNDLARVHCPIGLSIGAETPEEIAVSIVAELIQKRMEKKTG